VDEKIRTKTKRTNSKGEPQSSFAQGKVAWLGLGLPLKAGIGAQGSSDDFVAEREDWLGSHPVVQGSAFWGAGREDTSKCLDPQKEAHSSDELKAVANQAESPPAGVRILIADDDAIVRGSLAAVLESEGYIADEARNGIQAVTRAIEHPPDLVLLDLNMPHWDGWRAFQQLDRMSPSLPVIVITARPNQFQNAVRLKVDAFMEKPLNIPVLLDAIKQIISESKERHARRVMDPNFITALLTNADS
jgi:CheY-like chemotaxis protein